MRLKVSFFPRFPSRFCHSAPRNSSCRNSAPGCLRAPALTPDAQQRRRRMASPQGFVSAASPRAGRRGISRTNDKPARRRGIFEDKRQTRAPPGNLRGRRGAGRGPLKAPGGREDLPEAHGSNAGRKRNPKPTAGLPGFAHASTDLGQHLEGLHEIPGLLQLLLQTRVCRVQSQRLFPVTARRLRVRRQERSIP